MHMGVGTKHGADQPDSLWLVGAMVIMWLVFAVGGLFVVWTHENAPAKPATVESDWPANASLERAESLPTT